MASKNDNDRTELLEEIKNLRSSITSKQDANIKILTFTVSFISIVITIILANKTFISNVNIISSCFLLIFLFVAGCYLLIIRNVYSIKTIGGYIRKFYEDGVSSCKWETYSSRLSMVYRNYRHMDRRQRAGFPKPWFVLNGGTEKTLTMFYLILTFSSLTIYACLIYDKLSFSIFIEIVLVSLNIVLVLIIVYLSLIFNLRAKKWKDAWNYLSTYPEVPNGIEMSRGQSTGKRGTGKRGTVRPGDGKMKTQRPHDGKLKELGSGPDNRYFSSIRIEGDER